MKRFCLTLAVASTLFACGSPELAPTLPPKPPAIKDFARQINGETWSGIGSLSSGQNIQVLATFYPNGARATYTNLGCVARWSLIEERATNATYKEDIIRGDACTGSIVTVYGRDRIMSYNSRDRVGGKILATAKLSKTVYIGNGGPNIADTARATIAGDWRVTAPVVTPPRQCGTRPKRPNIPSRPAGLSCSSSAIKTRLSNCTVAGVAEVACGEALEGADTRIMTGAMNGAACSAATAVAQGRQPNTGDAAGSAIIGAVDNVGESMGGFFGGAVRLMAAGVKAGVVSECKRDVRVQCDPEVALRPYRERLARYENCVNDQ